MKKYLTVILALFASQCLFSQEQKESGANFKHGNLTAYLYELMQIQGKDNIKHEDTIRNYKINIPLWWKIRETPSESFFGGTFPAIEGIENALILKSFEKTGWKDLNDFENWVVKDYKLGDTPKWSNNSILLLKKKLDDFRKTGSAYSVQLNTSGKIYHCCYILLETRDTYLWIDFTATSETYDTNFEKFKSLIKDFKVIDK